MTFAAYPGAQLDGRRFITEAVARGAASVLWESDGFVWQPEWHVPNQGIAGLRAQISGIAGQIYGEPSRHLWVVGVTGTNGKTSCTHWLAQLLEQAGRPCAVVGTLGNGLRLQLEPALNTTPDAIALQQALARYRAQGAVACAMEVSSHGLVQDRVSGIAFRGALFTNLSRDHLDYHGTLEAYGEAKALLFDAAGLEFAAINLDDPFGVRLVEKIKASLGTASLGTDPEMGSVPKDAVPKIIGYTLEAARAPAGVSVLQARNIEINARGLQFQVAGEWGQTEVHAPLMGRFNVSNLLAVMAAALMAGMTLDQVRAGVARLTAPAGRLERLGGGALPNVVIDYAHTPDALEKALTTLRETVAPRRRLICVFGCGGNRDPGKRPLMGEVAARLADLVVLTSDNPRYESVETILDEIAQGMSMPFQRVPERAEAIRQAIAAAQAGDVVLIAGKGHETTQEVAGQKLPFSDRAVAQQCLDEVRA
jgi:UDP-N-acetylmuramoyl-L-alanyl-D-glutamate--2,6-diaminopimelate ligase